MPASLLPIQSYALSQDEKLGPQGREELIGSTGKRHHGELECWKYGLRGIKSIEYATPNRSGNDPLFELYITYSHCLLFHHSIIPTDHL